MGKLAIPITTFLDENYPIKDFFIWNLYPFLLLFLYFVVIFSKIDWFSAGKRSFFFRHSLWDFVLFLVSLHWVVAWLFPPNPRTQANRLTRVLRRGVQPLTERIVLSSKLSASGRVPFHAIQLISRTSRAEPSRYRRKLAGGKFVTFVAMAHLYKM